MEKITIIDEDSLDPENSSQKSSEVSETASSNSVEVESSHEPSEFDSKESSEITEDSTSRQLLFIGLLLSTFDHVSDALLIYSIWSKGLWDLALICLSVDLLPGPVTVLQFWTNGHGFLTSLQLICHPLNIYLHTAKVVFSKERQFFSEKVIGYSKECQGLIESPLQLIVTLALMYSDVIPLPGDTASSWTNSYGQKFDLSWLPFVSMMFSFLSVIFNAGQNLGAFQNLKTEMERVSAHLLFLISTVMFRVPAFVFIGIYTAEFSTIFVAIFLLYKIGLFYQQRTTDKSDPFLKTIYSTIIPSSSLKSLDNYTPDTKKLRIILTLGDNLIIAAGCLIVYLGIRLDWFNFSPHLRLNLDELVWVLGSLLALLVVSSASVFLLSQEWLVTQQKKSILKSIGYLVVALLCIITIFVALVYATTISTPNRLFIVGGNALDGELDDAEIFDLTTGLSSCKTPNDYPLPLFGGVGTFLDGKALVCGGIEFFGVAINECYGYNFGTELWTLEGRLTSQRIDAAAAMLDSENWWVTGGATEDGTLLKSTETYNVKTKQFSPYIDLPLHDHYHKLFEVNETHIFYCCGANTWSRAFIFEKSRRIWTELPSGNFLHTLGMAGRVVRSDGTVEVVATSSIFNRTEIFNFETMSWREVDDGYDGPYILGSQSVQYKDSFVAVGGLVRDEMSIYDRVLQFDLINDKYFTFETTLARARVLPTAMLIPDKLCN